MKRRDAGREDPEGVLRDRAPNSDAPVAIIEMESWRKAWRDGVEPLLGEPELEALNAAMLSDDPALIQGATTSPPPLSCVQDWPVESACLLGLCGWRGLGLVTVGEVEEYFARMCYEIDRRLGEPAGCRWFLAYYDETPRQEMIASLLPEVGLALARRRASRGDCAPPVGGE